MKNIILVGLGPHAKRIYYPFLEKYQTSHDIRLRLLIDLKSQSINIGEFLRGRTLRPENILYLPDTATVRSGEMLDRSALQALDALIHSKKIDGIIISTEPKAHKIYAEWALRNNIHVLMDKPITAPTNPSTDTRAADQIFSDYLALQNLTKNSSAKFYVMCQRRRHEGYIFIKNYLEKFVAEFGVPISYIDIYHADGAWSLPHEFFKENHPYKYGYGKLMHSGYHFIDLFSWIAGINDTLPHAKPDTAKVYATRFTPNDFFHQIGEKAYEKFFDNPTIKEFYTTYDRQTYEQFGELDACTLVQLFNGKNVVTTGSINLQQNSFSRRGWFDLPADTYKGNGRVRHERVTIQVSQFLNIQVHSYQSCGVGAEESELGAIGSQDHFDIFIFRNQKMIGGKAFEKISLGKQMKEANVSDAYYLGHNEKARELTLLNFIEGKNDDSELQHHALTNQLLSTIYKSIACGVQKKNPQIAFNIYE